MKIYKINYSKKAVKFIKKQQKTVQIKLIKAIENLPLGTDIKKLKGQVNLYRLRVNNIRIIYSVCEDVLIIEVIDIDNRGDIYKQL